MIKFVGLISAVYEYEMWEWYAVLCNVQCVLSCNLLWEILSVFCASVYTLYFVNSVWLYCGTSDQCTRASRNVHVYHFQIMHFYILNLYTFVSVSLLWINFIEYRFLSFHTYIFPHNSCRFVVIWLQGTYRNFRQRPSGLCCLVLIVCNGGTCCLSHDANTG